MEYSSIYEELIKYRRPRHNSHVTDYMVKNIPAWMAIRSGRGHLNAVEKWITHAGPHITEHPNVIEGTLRVNGVTIPDKYLERLNVSERRFSSQNSYKNPMSAPETARRLPGTYVRIKEDILNDPDINIPNWGKWYIVEYTYLHSPQLTIGYQFLNVFGQEFELIEKYLREMYNSQYLDKADISKPSFLYKTEWKTFDVGGDIVGKSDNDSKKITELNELESFLNAPPTAFEYVEKYPSDSIKGEYKGLGDIEPGRILFVKDFSYFAASPDTSEDVFVITNNRDITDKDENGIFIYDKYFNLLEIQSGRNEVRYDEKAELGEFEVVEFGITETDEYGNDQYYENKAYLRHVPVDGTLKLYNFSELEEKGRIFVDGHVEDDYVSILISDDEYTVDGNLITLNDTPKGSYYVEYEWVSSNNLNAITGTARFWDVSYADFLVRGKDEEGNLKYEYAGLAYDNERRIYWAIRKLAEGTSYKLVTIDPSDWTEVDEYDVIDSSIEPRGMCLWHDRLYVVDGTDKKIYTYNIFRTPPVVDNDPNVPGDNGYKIPNIDNPYGITFDEEGYMYIMSKEEDYSDGVNLITVKVYKFRPVYDYAMVDYDRKIIYTREFYDTVEPDSGYYQGK